MLNMWPSRMLASFSRAPNHMNQLLFISVDENSKAKQEKERKGKELGEKKKRNEKRKKRTQDKLCSNGRVEAFLRDTCHISCMPKERRAPQYLSRLACKHQAQTEIKTDLECSLVEPRV